MAPSAKRTPAPARKKACDQCATSKVRCDLIRPSCGRCLSRAIRCRYAASVGAPAVSEATQQIQNSNTREYGALLGPNYSPAAPGSLGQPSTPEPSGSASGQIALPSPISDAQHNRLDAYREDQGQPEASLKFDTLELVSTIDSAIVRDRWMESIVPTPDQVPKIVPPNTILFLSGVLKTYPKLMLKPDGLPPIIHPLQIINGRPPTPIANCYSLVRMWYGQVDGSEAIVIATVQKEMSRLLEEVRIPSCDFAVLFVDRMYLDFRAGAC
jgi:hypothetical protein